MPTLTDWQSELYEAWRTLSIGRAVAVGMQRSFALPVSAGDAIAVARAYGFEPRPFLHLCRTLDAIYLDDANQ